MDITQRRQDLREQKRSEGVDIAVGTVQIVCEDFASNTDEPLRVSKASNTDQPTSVNQEPSLNRDVMQSNELHAALQKAFAKVGAAETSRAVAEAARTSTQHTPGEGAAEAGSGDMEERILVMLDTLMRVSVPSSPQVSMASPPATVSPIPSALPEYAQGASTRGLSPSNIQTPAVTISNTPLLARVESKGEGQEQPEVPGEVSAEPERTMRDTGTANSSKEEVRGGAARKTQEEASADNLANAFVRSLRNMLTRKSTTLRARRAGNSYKR